MAMRKFYSEIKGLKVTEVPNHYIQTNSIDLPYHVCFGGMAFSYLVALLEERCHLKHQEHAKEHGGH
ncbi:hypothetical protein RGQ29_006456 [Quercus rubra]|uniref:Uncharacterized protein n=1 Tax=Quercus rubra TaxID=3512 RepID=A0AAN7IC00_QUERU|nr:hypothetical protein RGQ29_006456 [Quercus rubra]